MDSPTGRPAESIETEKQLQPEANIHTTSYCSHFFVSCELFGLGVMLTT